MFSGLESRPSLAPLSLFSRANNANGFPHGAADFSDTVYASAVQGRDACARTHAQVADQYGLKGTRVSDKSPPTV